MQVTDIAPYQGLCGRCGRASRAPAARATPIASPRVRANDVDESDGKRIPELPANRLTSAPGRPVGALTYGGNSAGPFPAPGLHGRGRPLPTWRKPPNAGLPRGKTITRPSQGGPWAWSLAEPVDEALHRPRIEEQVVRQGPGARLGSGSVSTVTGSTSTFHGRQRGRKKRPCCWNLERTKCQGRIERGAPLRQTPAGRSGSSEPSLPTYEPREEFDQ